MKIKELIILWVVGSLTIAAGLGVAFAVASVIIILNEYWPQLEVFGEYFKCGIAILLVLLLPFAAGASVLTLFKDEF